MFMARMMLPVLVFALFLTACTSVRPATVTTPPAERLTCAAEPLAPANASDIEAARYIVALRGAWVDCSDAVAWLRDWARGVSAQQGK